MDLEIIPEVDIYKCEPWDLQQKSLLPGRDLEWAFFCSRDRKYPNGSRTNRATKAGYWKATGKEREVTSHMRLIGMKKTLVFYRGRAPHGSRTNWVMHEYRLDNNECQASPSFQDAYALCRILKKSEPGPKIAEQYGEPVEKYFSSGMNNLLDKNSFFSVEEQYDEKLSPLSHAEEHQTNSKGSSSETRKDINVDDGALKRFQLLDFDHVSSTFSSSNEPTNQPKAEHYESSWQPLEVDDFPNTKTCLIFSYSRMVNYFSDSRMQPSTYLGSRQIHWPVEEIYYSSQFINSDVADIQYNEDFLQLMTPSLGGSYSRTIKTAIKDMEN